MRNFADITVALVRRSFATRAALGGLSLFAGLILTLHIACVVRVAADNSPVQPEIDGLPAGLSHLRFRRFDLARVNPPLVRSIAAVPLLFQSVSVDWSHWKDYPGSRAERELGRDFLQRNSNAVPRVFFAARVACIPLYLISAVVIFFTASELYGVAAANLALFLWCSHPIVLGHSALISTDVAAASLATLTLYSFNHWIKTHGSIRALACGLSLGLALSCKFSMILLLPVMLLEWTLRRLRDRSVQPDMAEWAPVILSALLVVNATYLFEGSFLPLKAHHFVSRTFGGNVPPLHNRWGRSAVGAFPVPLPANYLRGIDQQNKDLENVTGDYPSYLRGQWSDTGWWYFYLYGLLVKTPCPTLALLAVAVATALSVAVRWKQDERLLVLFPLAVLFAASTNTGFTLHLRYILPAVPFLCILASRVTADGVGLRLKRLAWCLAVCSAISVALAAPNWLSYYNAAARLMGRGDWHMLSSNTDWGQDLFRLRRWVEAHADSGPVYADCDGDMPLSFAGAPSTHTTKDVNGVEVIIWPEGLYALSVGQLRSRDGRYTMFLDRPPIDLVGGSIAIFRIESHAKLGGPATLSSPK